jgi:hypothetical protein
MYVEFVRRCPTKYYPYYYPFQVVGWSLMIKYKPRRPKKLTLQVLP